MLRCIDDLYAFTVAATDDPIGQVKDCYFDDQTWTSRFLVVETGV